MTKTNKIEMNRTEAANVLDNFSFDNLSSNVYQWYLVRNISSKIPISNLDSLHFEWIRRKLCHQID